MGIKNFTFGKRNNIYSNYDKDQLLNMFQSDNWNKLNSSKRMQLLEAIGDSYAKEIGLKNRPVFLRTYDKSAYGKYTKYAVKINLGECSNPYRALDTTVHELNHAYQMQCIKEGNGKYSEGERAILKTQCDKGYIDKGDDYLRQSIEVDSNNAGIEYLLSEKERFQSDPAYIEHLKLRYGDYEEIGSDYQKNRAICDAVEYGQIADAFLDNEISVQERDAAEECILKDENSIKQKCTYLRDDVKKSFFECALQQERDKYRDNNLSQEQIYDDVTGRAKEQHRIYEERKDNLSTVYNWKEKNEIEGLMIDNHLMKKIFENIQKEFVKQRETAMKELSNRIMSNNMNLPESRRDSECQRLSKEIKEYDQKISNCKYHIAELDIDNQLISESTRIKIEDYTEEEQQQSEIRKDNDDLKAVEEQENELEKEEVEETLEQESYETEEYDEGLEQDILEEEGYDDGLGSEETSQESYEAEEYDEGLDQETYEAEECDDGLGIEENGQEITEEEGYDDSLGSDDGLESEGSEQDAYEKDGYDDGLESEGTEEESYETDGYDDGLESEGTGEGVFDDGLESSSSSGMSSSSESSSSSGMSSSSGSSSSSGMDASS